MMTVWKILNYHVKYRIYLPSALTSNSEESDGGNASDEQEPLDLLDEEGDEEEDSGSSKKNAKTTLHNRQKLVKKALEYKKLCEEENAKRKSVYNEKRKEWVTPIMSWGYLSRTIRNEYPYLKDAKHDNADLKNKIKMLNRAIKLYGTESSSEQVPAFKTKYMTYGDGRHCKLPEVRYAAFDWFVDHSHLLKCRLSRVVFKTILDEIQENFIKQQVDGGKEAPSKIKFSNRWLKTWCKQFGISLKNPNKRYAYSYDERKIRIIEMIKNVWRARLFFLHKFKMEPVIWGGDQMPLHRNEQTT